MIKKLDIDVFGLFSNYKWDTEIGKIKNFRRVNIIYGRNYSGNVASLAEIKENDYNLNIPRYVDTFEEEEPIDLEKVSSEYEKY